MRAARPAIRDRGDTSWVTEAACRQADPELFYSAAGDAAFPVWQIREAKEFCAVCPVRAECLTYFMSDPFAIAGGMTPQQRESLQRRRRKEKKQRESDRCAAR